MGVKAGLNYLDKNNILQLRDDGLTADEIAATQGFRLEQVVNLIILDAKNPRKKAKGKQVGDAGERAIQAALAEQEPEKPDAAAQPSHDDFGPLKGSADWDELTPGERSKLTRARNLRKDKPHGGTNLTLHT